GGRCERWRSTFISALGGWRLGAGAPSLTYVACFFEQLDQPRIVCLEVAAQPRELGSDRIEHLYEVFPVGARNPGVQVRVARSKPAHVAKSSCGQARSLWPVVAPRQRQHVADREQKCGMAHARDEPVMS